MRLLNDIWKISENDFPRSGSDQEKLQFLLNYAILAPSSHNTQPWYFKIEHDQILVFADYQRSLTILDGQHRELLISCGTAIYFLQIAMMYFRVLGELHLFPEMNRPELLAIVTLGSGSTNNNEAISALFHAITKRHTLRIPYKSNSIPEPLLEEMLNIAHQHDAWLRLVNKDQKEMLKQLIADADKMQYENLDFRQELLQWLRSNKDAKKDGMPMNTLGLSADFDFLANAMLFLAEHFNLGKMIANHDAYLVEKSAQLMVLGTFEDTPLAWLNVGQTLGQLILFATANNLAHAYENQPCEMTSKRNEISNILAQAGYPQIILRLGFVDDADWQKIPHSPRRSIASVLR